MLAAREVRAIPLSLVIRYTRVAEGGTLLVLQEMAQTAIRELLRAEQAVIPTVEQGQPLPPLVLWLVGVQAIMKDYSTQVAVEAAVLDSLPQDCD
jgi:hypothetical protein